MKMLHDQKIWVRLVCVISIILVLAWTCIVWWVYAQQREMGIRQAHDFAFSVNQMVMASLTGMMITSTMDQRSVYLDQIQQAENIRELRVVQGGPIDKQFGAAKTAQKPDQIEQRVMQTGKPAFEVLQDEKAKVCAQ